MLSLMINKAIIPVMMTVVFIFNMQLGMINQIDIEVYKAYFKDDTIIYELKTRKDDKVIDMPKVEIDTDKGLSKVKINYRNGKKSFEYEHGFDGNIPEDDKAYIEKILNDVCDKKPFIDKLGEKTRNKVKNWLRKKLD